MTSADLDLPFLSGGRHFHLSSLYLQKDLHPDLPQIFQHLKSAGPTISLGTNDDPDDRRSASWSCLGRPYGRRSVRVASRQFVMLPLRFG